MTILPSWIGIDIAKAHLDIADRTHGGVMRIANEATAVADLAGKLAGRGVIVVLEARGSCERVLRHALAQAGVACARVNPLRARDFARATGRLAKTDSIDARMLAAMGEALRLQPDQPPGLSLEQAWRWSAAKTEIEIFKSFRAAPHARDRLVCPAGDDRRKVEPEASCPCRAAGESSVHAVAARRSIIQDPPKARRGPAK